MTTTEIKFAMEEHKEWLDSIHTRGKQAVFSNQKFDNDITFDCYKGVFIGCIFSNNIKRSALDDCLFIQCTFLDANCQYTFFNHSRFFECNFSNVDLSYSKFKFCQFYNTKFLFDIAIEDIDFSFSKFIECDIFVSLSTAKQIDTIFVECNFSNIGN